MTPRSPPTLFSRHLPSLRLLSSFPAIFFPSLTPFLPPSYAPIPLQRNRAPSSSTSPLRVGPRLCSLLKHSLRTTSNGFVRTAPASPAVTALMADRWTRRDRALSTFSGTGSSHSSICKERRNKAEHTRGVKIQGFHPMRPRSVTGMAHHQPRTDPFSPPSSLPSLPPHLILHHHRSHVLWDSFHDPCRGAKPQALEEERKGGRKEGREGGREGGSDGMVRAPV